MKKPEDIVVYLETLKQKTSNMNLMMKIGFKTLLKTKKKKF